MDADSSFLSSPKYGYDFVVSTTQASINSDLLLFLSESQQPVQYLCFLADDTGNPTNMVTLEEVLKLTDNVNPFDIPAGTDYSDARITKVTAARFMVGVQIQMGLPPGVLPKNLPSIVDLGDDAKTVKFNMFCSQFTVIENTPGNAWTSGVWSVYSQPSGTPWYVQVNVDLVMKDLDKELDTPYLNNHPELKAQLKAQLMNLSSTAFSLKQLLFDLSNAVLETVPRFEGVPEGSQAEAILQRSFVSIYSDLANSHGLPLVSVTADVTGTPDPSQLQMTSFEREVNPPKDSTGAVIPSPTALQKSATTLDYLCAINDKPLPGVSSFNWNWVLPADINDKSGVIAINRNIIAQNMLDQLLPAATNCCLRIEPYAFADWYWATGEFDVTVYQDQTPDTAKVTDSGSEVVQFDYYCARSDDSHWGATYCALDVNVTYNCGVYFEDDTIIVKQHLVIFVHARVDWITGDANVFDKTITDTYTISVDQYGGLKIAQTASVPEDNSQEPNLNWFSDTFSGINGVCDKIQSKVTSLASSQMKSTTLSGIQNFVFPGGKVFTYKSPRFSAHQDLACDITYVDPASTVESRRKARQALRSTEPTLGLTCSSDMLLNYVQGQLVSPTGNFEALQTQDGHALLFATDSSGVFHVIEEQSGVTSTGWQLHDLSTSVITSYFPGKTDAVVRTFGVGQSAIDGTISLAMAVSCAGTDNLFMSLLNSNGDTSWIENPRWTQVPFDAVTEWPETITVTGIMFAELSDPSQYLIVDLDRLNDSAVKNIVRYYIDPSKETGVYWVKHDVPVDIEDGNYQSCVGRVTNAWSDGVYTLGTTDGAPQLVYMPVINDFGTGPPASRRLSLPGSQVPSAIATARNGDKSSSLLGTTDLYAISNTSLYYFAANAQTDGSTAVPLITNDFLSGTDTLLSMILDGVTTLWGRNSSNEVYYLSCPNTELTKPGSWSAPVPILTSIERISAYMNRIDGGNTIFASGNGRLFSLTQATVTDAKVWQAQDIKLAAPATEKPLSFTSYTTTIQVTDTKNDAPAAKTTLNIAAEVRTPVYINGLYYVLGPDAVKVTTDASGSVSVIQATDDLNAVTLTVTIDGSAVSTVINSMDTSFQKLSALNTEDSLRAASFPTNTTAGGILDDTSTTPLVAASTDDADVKTIASRMTNLQDLYSKAPSKTALLSRQLGRQINPTPRPITSISPAKRVVPSTQFLASRNAKNILDDIAIAAGDLFNWLKSGIEAVIDIVYDAVSDAWHFVATIAGKVYRAILDTVDAIVGAVVWVFNAIKTAIEDLIRFIEFLFNWGDVKRTKNVLYNVAKLYMQNQVDSIPRAKAAFDAHIAEAEETLGKWAGITDWTPIGTAASEPASGSTSNPAKGQTSGSRLLADHFQNQVHQVSILGDLPSEDATQSLVDQLLDGLSKEGVVLSQVYNQLRDLASNFSSLSVGDILKKLAVILADGVLSSAQVVVDALLDVLQSIAESAISLLDTKMHIPIISDILNAIGIPDITFLDLFAWIAAVGYTVVYKIANNEAPFPDTSDVNAIISASTWDDLAALFRTQSVKKVNARTGLTPTSASITLPQAVQSAVFIASHASAGFLLFTSDFVTTFEAEIMTGENPFSIPSGVLGFLIASMEGGGNFLVPKAPIDNFAVSVISDVTTTASIISKVLFSGPVQNKLKTSGSKFSGLAVDDGRATGAIVNTVLIIPALFVTGWHFYELSSKPEGADRSAAIVGEVSNLTSYVSRVSYAVAVNDLDPATRQIPIGVMAACNLVDAGLQTAEAIIH
ncbi:hypothetical protein BO70DRAFT_379664 [Aspergillus heteromorphus CBS 117.55]|uniref:Uncharacterized protein n=1 Tax=Aspergillus heteromorphus CBS 117.55 TaxID=1448321 RepID=A0A317W6B8_9EURO|nr:uncharacterized protein BO70DRAFT_379664 [Aspergillus heteromorphus CBS 117.55]PWY82154.1 hypothetical protein BO70DRAFT_379664 [Aspergillus heteromorphus CBS 117.55]